MSDKNLPADLSPCHIKRRMMTGKNHLSFFWCDISFIEIDPTGCYDYIL